MAQRYVRVKTIKEEIYYGILELDRSIKVLNAPPWLGGRLTQEVLEANSYKLIAPCAPSKIIGVGKNYIAHAVEMGTPVPQEPLLFLKPPTAVTADRQSIFYPQVSNRVDYEGELALVVGERCHNLTLEQAESKIWGYTIANDVTARDLQQKDGQWTRAKGFDSFCPLGPWIVREINSEAKLQTFINEEEKPRQSATISSMIFSPAELVAYISNVMTLLPGDIILTGTPKGVGAINVGDQVRIEIQGIGSLENLVTLPIVPNYSTVN